MTTRPRLYYFDAPVSRGEECRIALHLAGVDFEDVRVKREDWPALKTTVPFGALPVLELPERPRLAQSNAILVYVGRRWGLHPKDDFEAARHEGILAAVEDLRVLIGATNRVAEPAEKKKARETFAQTALPGWAANVEAQIVGPGPFFGGAVIHVADVKLFNMARQLLAGTLDHVPPSVIAGYPKIMRLHDAVKDHPGVKAWFERK
jgi:glutathione S-transferase